MHLKKIVNHSKVTNKRLLGIVTDNASSDYSMTLAQQSTLDASVILYNTIGNYIPYMAHVIQLALGAFMSSLGVKGRTKSLVSHE